jgi:hypothetical protein
MRDCYQAYETKQLQGTCDFKPFIQFVQLQEQHLNGFLGFLMGSGSNI